MQIDGSGFGGSAPGDEAVTVGNIPANITAWSDSQISITLPSLPPGNHSITVYTGSNGYAVSG